MNEADVQNAIVEALIWDGWLVFEINQGAMEIDDRYVRFAVWQALGMDAQDSGIADVLADKQVDEVLYYQDGITGEFIPYDKEVCIHLAVEVKAPGKKSKVTAKQQAFLDAVTEHGGISIVADCLEDVAPYLDRAEVQ